MTFLRIRRLIVCLAVLLTGCLPAAAAAAPLKVDVSGQLGVSNTILNVLDNIVTFLGQAIVFVSGAMFLTGAFLLILSGARESLKELGKNLMIGSLVGLGVVLGSYAIWRTVAWFLTVL